MPPTSFTRLSLQREPFLRLTGYPERADLTKILLCQTLKYSHHAKKLISASDDGTNAERNSLSDARYLITNGTELAAFW